MGVRWGKVLSWPHPPVKAVLTVCFSQKGFTELGETFLSGKACTGDLKALNAPSPSWICQLCCVNIRIVLSVNCRVKIPKTTSESPRPSPLHPPFLKPNDYQEAPSGSMVQGVQVSTATQYWVALCLLVVWCNTCALKQWSPSGFHGACSHICLIFKSPELGTVFQLQSRKCWTERRDCSSGPCSAVIFNGAQHVVGHLHLHLSLRAPDQPPQSCFTTSLCPGSTTAST